MAKQVGHVKAVGTVDDNVNFYYSELDGYLARLLPGVNTQRFWNDPAFEGSRRSAESEHVVASYKINSKACLWHALFFKYLVNRNVFLLA